MTKTLRLLLALACVWLCLWFFVGFYVFRRLGLEDLRSSEWVAAPSEALADGADLRVLGTIGEGPTSVAPLVGAPCLAAKAEVSYVARYRDIHDNDLRDAAVVATRVVGPRTIPILVDGERLELPLESWTPEFRAEGERFSVDEALPPSLEVTPEDIDAARAKVNSSLYSAWIEVSQATLRSGERLLVVGRLGGEAGALRLGADPVLGRVILFAGTQDELSRELRGSGRGLVLAGWIVGAGVAPLPLAILSMVLLVRRRRVARPESALSR